MAKQHEHRWAKFRGSNVPGEETERCAGCFKLKSGESSASAKPEDKDDKK